MLGSVTHSQALPAYGKKHVAYYPRHHTICRYLFPQRDVDKESHLQTVQYNHNRSKTSKDHCLQGKMRVDLCVYLDVNASGSLEERHLCRPSASIISEQ